MCVGLLYFELLQAKVDHGGESLFDVLVSQFKLSLNLHQSIIWANGGEQAVFLEPPP